MTTITGRVLLVFAVGFAAFGAATLTSAHGGDEDLIHSCVNANSGVIKIVDGDAACASNEVALDWNQTGPAGPAGPQGPQGDVGPQGETGPTGPAASTIMVTATSSVADPPSCQQGTLVTTVPITLAQPSRLLVRAEGLLSRYFSPDIPAYGRLRVELRDATDTLVGRRNGTISPEVAEAESATLVADGILRDAGHAGIYTAPAGAYTAKVFIDMFGGCTGAQQFQEGTLDIVGLGS